MGRKRGRTKGEEGKKLLSSEDETPVHGGADEYKSMPARSPDSHDDKSSRISEQGSERAKRCHGTTGESHLEEESGRVKHTFTLCS